MHDNEKLMARWSRGNWMQEENSEGYEPPLTDVELYQLSEALKELQTTARKFGATLETVLFWASMQLNAVNLIQYGRAKNRPR